MNGLDAALEAARRLEHDLRDLFPAAAVVASADDDGDCVVVIDWGAGVTGLPDKKTLGWAAADDEIDAAGVEQVVLELADEVATNLWPDEMTDPWPLCPEHGDHPLLQAIVRGKASWYCTRDQRIAIPVGKWSP